MEIQCEIIGALHEFFGLHGCVVCPAMVTTDYPNQHEFAPDEFDIHSPNGTLALNVNYGRGSIDIVSATRKLVVQYADPDSFQRLLAFVNGHNG